MAPAKKGAKAAAAAPASKKAAEKRKAESDSDSGSGSDEEAAAPAAAAPAEEEEVRKRAHTSATRSRRRALSRCAAVFAHSAHSSRVCFPVFARLPSRRATRSRRLMRRPRLRVATSTALSEQHATLRTGLPRECAPRTLHATQVSNDVLTCFLCILLLCSLLTVQGLRHCVPVHRQRAGILQSVPHALRSPPAARFHAPSDP